MKLKEGIDGVGVHDCSLVTLMLSLRQHLVECRGRLGSPGASLPARPAMIHVSSLINAIDKVLSVNQPPHQCFVLYWYLSLAHCDTVALNYVLLLMALQIAHKH